MSSLALDVTQAVSTALGDRARNLHEPTMQGNEERYLHECVASGMVSSVGPFVKRFEQMLQEVTGARRAVAVSSGTAALQIALRLAGVRQGDEVLVPSLTFIATANAVSYLGAFPHFVDIEETTLGIDPETLRKWLLEISEVTQEGLRNKTTGRIIRALVPMHTFGHPSQIEVLCEVANAFNLVVVEDAAESLGSTYKEKHTGTFGLLGAVSFNGNKIVTTGGGGAVLTDDDKLANRAKHLSTTAKKPHSWEYVHDEIGYNFRMPNINAALGVAQLEQLPEFLSSKRALMDKYRDAFDSIDTVSIMSEPTRSRSNYWLHTLRLNEDGASCRDEILEALNAAGFGARPVWRPLHSLEIYETASRAPLPVTEKLGQALINLPSSAGLA